MSSQDNKAAHDPNVIELPTPTMWPVFAAFGLSLAFAGLVTSFFICLIGIICGLFGAVGWIRDIFPHSKHEAFPIHSKGGRAFEITPSPRTVRHLHIGEHGHRARIPVEIHPYSAGVLGGLAGGVAMALLAMLYGLIAQGSIWYPINLLAAAGVESLATADTQVLREFSLIGLVVGIIAHGSVSILIGLLYTTLLPMLPAKFEWFWGGIITPLIWTGLLYPVIGIVNPALAARVDWPWFIACQVAFGIVGGFVVFKSGKIDTMQNWSIAAKMGVEAMDEEDPK